MSFNLESALREANDLEDDNLNAALQLAEGDERWEALHRPPEVPPERSGTDPMCPGLYRATQTGKIHDVNQLLGPTEDITHVNDVNQLIGPTDDITHMNFIVLLEITSMLLDWKPELANERDASGTTPLHSAASNGDITVINNILDKAPLTVYIRDEEGSSPLHDAARMCHYSVICSMIDHCPDSFELRDNQGQNFLHIVAQNGGTYFVMNEEWTILVNERDNEGNTPVHIASMNGFSEILEQFLKVSKADTTQMNNEGMTALDNAISLSSFSLMVQSPTFCIICHITNDHHQLTYFFS